MKLFTLILATVIWNAKFSFEWDYVVYGENKIGTSYASRFERALKSGPPTITDFIVKTTVQNNYAESHVFSNVMNIEDISKQTIFSVVLPDNAFVSDFFMEIGGKTYQALVLKKEEAQKIYSQASAVGQSAAHVSVSTRNANRFSVVMNVEPRSNVSFHLVYEELLQRDKGYYAVVANIQPGQIVRNLLVEVKIQESRPLEFVRTPYLQSGNVKVKSTKKLDPDAAIDVRGSSALVRFRPDLRRQVLFACVGLGNKQFDGFAGQFIVHYDVKRKSDSGMALCDDDIMVVSLTPPPKSEPIPKHIVFLLDRSGSMAGTKLTQLKEAMQSILSKLHPGDLFELVEFEGSAFVRNTKGHLINAIPPNAQYGNLETSLQHLPIADALPVTRKTIEFASKVVNNMVAQGGTHSIGALEVGLYLIKRVQQKYKDQYQPILIFLTDGMPNVGVKEEDTIVKLVRSINEKQYKTPIYALVIGTDAKWDFLRELSLSSGGFPTRIHITSASSPDISIQLQKFYEKISSPILRNITFNLPPSVQGVNNHFPLIFNGSEIVAAGIGGSNFDCKDVTITAISKTGPKLLVAKPEVPVARLKRVWAFLTVKQLLDKYYSTSSQTEKTTLSEQILEIALKHSLVTDLTSLVVFRPNHKGTIINIEDASTGLFPEPLDGLPMCKDISEFCLLNEDAGDCKSDVTKWTYNKRRGECKKFYYSGCGGNDNRFDSEEDCKFACVHQKSKEVCYLPENYGTCSSDKPLTKWAYSEVLGQCKKMYYGGCGGNENRFETKEECVKLCTGKQEEEPPIDIEAV